MCLFAVSLKLGIRPSVLGRFHLVAQAQSLLSEASLEQAENLPTSRGKHRLDLRDLRFGNGFLFISRVLLPHNGVCRDAEVMRPDVNFCQLPQRGILQPAKEPNNAQLQSRVFCCVYLLVQWPAWYRM